MLDTVALAATCEERTATLTKFAGRDKSRIPVIRIEPMDTPNHDQGGRRRETTDEIVVSSTIRHASVEAAETRVRVLRSASFDWLIGVAASLFTVSLGAVAALGINATAAAAAVLGIAVSAFFVRTVVGAFVARAAMGALQEMFRDRELTPGLEDLRQALASERASLTSLARKIHAE